MEQTNTFTRAELIRALHAECSGELAERIEHRAARYALSRQIDDNQRATHGELRLLGIVSGPAFDRSHERLKALFAEHDRLVGETTGELVEGEVRT